MTFPVQYLDISRGSFPVQYLGIFHHNARPLEKVRDLQCKGLINFTFGSYFMYMPSVGVEQRTLHPGDGSLSLHQYQYHFLSKIREMTRLEIIRDTSRAPDLEIFRCVSRCHSYTSRYISGIRKSFGTVYRQFPLLFEGILYIYMQLQEGASLPVFVALVTEDNLMRSQLST